MRKKFLEIFRVLLASFNSKTSIIEAWKIAKLQGKRHVSYIKTNGTVARRETTGNYTFYVSKSNEIVVNYIENEGIKSFRLENLIYAE